MNFQQLETFRAIAACGSFTQAAQLLNTTQSAVSIRIAQLERELGATFLDRSKRTIRLTPAGKDLLGYADEIHRLTAEMKQTIGNPETTPASIRVGVAELVALTWLPRLVAELNQQYPKLEVQIEVGLSGNMFSRVLGAEIDICLHPAILPLASGLSATLLGKVRFAYMASPRIELPKRRLKPGDLAKMPLISFGPDSMIAETQARWFADASAAAVNLKQSNSMAVSAGLVRSGLGISFLPEQYYASDAKDGALRALNVTPRPSPIPFFAIHNTSNTAPLIAKIVEIAKDGGAFDA